MITDEAPVTTDDAGCWIAGGSHNRPEEMCAAAIEIAERYGRNVDPAISDAIARLGAGVETDTDCEWLSDEGDSSVEWMNEHIIPTGMALVWDDGLMLYADAEDELYLD